MSVVQHLFYSKQKILLSLTSVSVASVLLSACGSFSSGEDEDADGSGDGDGDHVDGTGAAGSGGSANSGGNANSGGAGFGSGGDSSAGGSPFGSGGQGTGGETNLPVTCPTPVLGSGDETRTLTVGGQSRSYILHVPQSYSGDAPVPLIVDFHPLGGSGSGQRSQSQYPAQVDSEGVIMAFPSGLMGPLANAWNVGPCCVADVDDVEFARALVADVQADACIDPKRIYAAGFSMGGGMSHYLACHAADLFAAVAPAAFDLLDENIGDCNPSRPISVVSFRGTNDGTVAYDGGYSAVVPGMAINFLGAEDTQDAWAEMNGCTGEAVSIGDGCTQYSTCDAGVSVTLCTKQGGGHEQGNAAIGWPILKNYTLP